MGGGPAARRGGIPDGPFLPVSALLGSNDSVDLGRSRIGIGGTGTSAAGAGSAGSVPGPVAADRPNMSTSSASALRKRLPVLPVGALGRENTSLPPEAGCQSGAAPGPPGNAPPGTENGGIRSGRPPGADSPPERVRPRTGSAGGASGVLLGGAAGTGVAAPSGDAAHHGRVGSTAEGEPTRGSPVGAASAALLRRPVRSRRGTAPTPPPGVEGEEPGTTGLLPVPKMDDPPVVQLSKADVDAPAAEPDPAGRADASSAPPAGSSPCWPFTPTRSAQEDESVESGSDPARRRPDPRGRRGRPARSSDSGGTVICRGARSPCVGAVRRSHRRDDESTAPTPSPPLSLRPRRLRRP